MPTVDQHNHIPCLPPPQPSQLPALALELSPGKKVNDDAAYFGPPASSTSVSVTKRQAPDKAEGEPRVKRKQVETHTDIRGNWSVKCSEGKDDRSFDDLQGRVNSEVCNYQVIVYLNLIICLTGRVQSFE